MGQCTLYKQVVGILVLVIIVPVTVALVMELADTPGPVVVDTVMHQVITPGAVATHEAIQLQGEAVAGEKRVEFQKGRVRRTGVFQQGKVGLGQLWLHRVQVDGLQQL